jgi:hypothetical protein
MPLFLATACGGILKFRILASSLTPAIVPRYRCRSPPSTLAARPHPTTKALPLHIGAAIHLDSPCLTMTNNNNTLDSRLRPPNGTHQPPPPSHPSKGGNPYSDDFCRQVLQMYLDDYDLRNAPELIALRAEKKFPSYSTCISWIRIFNETGDICPKRATGNHHAVREV